MALDCVADLNYLVRGPLQEAARADSTIHRVSCSWIVEDVPERGVVIVSNCFPAPDETKLLNVVTKLFGSDASVKASAAHPSDEALCAVYLSDDDAPVAAVLCDPAFGAYAGSALSMITARGAADAAASGDLSDAMVDNLYEVMQICSILFTDDAAPRLRLGPLHKRRAERTDEVNALLGVADGPSFTIQIPHYGSGVLRLVS